MSIFRYIAGLGVCAGMSVQPVMAMTTEEACDNIARAGEAVMIARQKGIPLQQELGVVLRSREIAATKDAIRLLINMAYQQPRFDTDEAKAKAIADFRDQVVLICMQGGK